ncbi:MAG: PDZ domain-containing protein [Bacteroidales bacterium]|nr:PDZ domain-containing protein [Bacteroidales bacterium]
MNNPKNKSVYFPIVFSLVLIFGILIGIKLAPINPIKFYSSRDFLKSINKHSKIDDIISYIEQNYVDSVNGKKIEETAIKSILQTLDPHSVYISAEEFNEVNDQLVGNFEGIGIEFRIQKDTLFVIHTINGGPSEKAGLRDGDRIVKVEGKNIAGVNITSREAMKLLKGKRNTKVNISVFRKGVPGLINFVITRDIIPSYSVDFSYMLNDSIGYIKLSKFSETTYKEMHKSIETLKNKGMTRLMLDLRGNSGGYLQAAVNLSNEFLDKGKLIVYTEGNNRPKKYFYATENGIFTKQKLIILIDEGSASASEIVAGAIQDNDRGTIVGRRSFGKGLVQEQLFLSDGSAIRLTIARYHTPSGRCIQRPYNNGIKDYYNDYYNRFIDGEMQYADSIHFPDSLKYFTPKGKIVYGGGGIMPDVFVPIETGKNYAFYNSLINKGVIYQFAFNYTDINRKKIIDSYTEETFNKNFIITDSIFNELIEYAEKKGVKRNKISINNCKKEISILLKSLIGRNTFGDKCFYPIYHKSDNIFQKALEIINTEN